MTRCVVLKYAFCAKWQYLCDVMHAILKVEGLVHWDKCFKGRMETVRALEVGKREEV